MRLAGLSAAAAAAGRSGGMALPEVVPVDDVEVPAPVVPVVLPVVPVEPVTPVVPVVLPVDPVDDVPVEPVDDVPVEPVDDVPVLVDGAACVVALPVSPPAEPVSAAMAVPAKPSAEAIAPHINVRVKIEFIVGPPVRIAGRCGTHRRLVEFAVARSLPSLTR